MVAMVLSANLAFAGHRDNGHGRNDNRGHQNYDRHNDYRGNNRGHHSGHSVWRDIAIGAGVVTGLVVIDSIIDPPPRVNNYYYSPPSAYRCPPPCRDSYVRAYEEEQARIRRQEQYRWEQEQRERGRRDAQEDYYGR